MHGVIIVGRGSQRCTQRVAFPAISFRNMSVSDYHDEGQTSVVLGVAGAAAAIVAITWLVIIARVAFVHAATRGMPTPGFWWVLLNFNTFHDSVASLHKRVGGGLYNLFLGHRNVVVVANPDLVKQVVNDGVTFAKMPASEIWTSKCMTEFVGVSLVTANGDAWKRVKRIVGPAFHMTNVRRLIPTFHSRTGHMFDLLEQYHTATAKSESETITPEATAAPDGSPTCLTVDFCEWASRVTLDFLGQTLFSYDLGSLPDRISADSLSTGPRGASHMRPSCPACGKGSLP